MNEREREKERERERLGFGFGIWAWRRDGAVEERERRNKSSLTRSIRRSFAVSGYEKGKIMHSAAKPFLARSSSAIV